MPQRGSPKGNNSNEGTPKPVPKPNQERGDNKANTPKKPEPEDTGVKCDAFNNGKPLERGEPSNAGVKSDAFNNGKPLEIERPQNGTV